MFAQRGNRVFHSVPVNVDTVTHSQISKKHATDCPLSLRSLFIACSQNDICYNTTRLETINVLEWVEWAVFTLLLLNDFAPDRKRQSGVPYSSSAVMDLSNALICSLLHVGRFRLRAKSFGLLGEHMLQPPKVSRRITHVLLGFGIYTVAICLFAPMATGSNPPARSPSSQSATSQPAHNDKAPPILATDYTTKHPIIAKLFSFSIDTRTFAELVFHIKVINVYTKPLTVYAVVYATNNDVSPPWRSVWPSQLWPEVDFKTGEISASKIEQTWKSRDESRRGWKIELAPRTSYTNECAMLLRDVSPLQPWHGEPLDQTQPYKHWTLWVFSSDGRLLAENTVTINAGALLQTVAPDAP